MCRNTEEGIEGGYAWRLTRLTPKAVYIMLTMLLAVLLTIMLNHQQAVVSIQESLTWRLVIHAGTGLPLRALPNDRCADALPTTRLHVHRLHVRPSWRKPQSTAVRLGNMQFLAVTFVTPAPTSRKEPRKQQTVSGKPTFHSPSTRKGNPMAEWAKSATVRKSEKASCAACHATLIHSWSSPEPMFLTICSPSTSSDCHTHKIIAQRESRTQSARATQQAGACRGQARNRGVATARVWVMGCTRVASRNRPSSGRAAVE